MLVCLMPFLLTVSWSAHISTASSKYNVTVFSGESLNLNFSLDTSRLKCNNFEFHLSRFDESTQHKSLVYSTLDRRLPFRYTIHHCAAEQDCADSGRGSVRLLVDDVQESDSGIYVIEFRCRTDNQTSPISDFVLMETTYDVRVIVGQKTPLETVTRTATFTPVIATTGNSIAAPRRYHELISTDAPEVPGGALDWFFVFYVAGVAVTCLVGFLVPFCICLLDVVNSSQ